MSNVKSDSTLPTGLYIHIPFCEKKCPYCDFNTYAGLDSLYADTVEAICTELARWKEPLAGRRISTIFFGGGTPTALALADLARLMETVEQTFELEADCEITSEVNPGTVDREKFRGLRSLGINRLSIGVQSLQPTELTFLGRIHSVQDVYKAYEAARLAGFDNINLDFMFGLADQTEPDWQDTLKQAIELDPEHLSLYSLIVEPNTPLHHWVSTGQTSVPDDDYTGKLYETAIEMLGNAGYLHYEVSNWSKQPLKACKHNLIYWRNQEYLGVGPGAHSHLRLPHSQLKSGLLELPNANSMNGNQNDASSISWLRWGNCKPVASYGRRMRQGESVSAFQEQLDPATAMGETMMLGLRLVQEGIEYKRFEALHQIDSRTVFATEFERLRDWAALEFDDHRVRLTPQGLMVGNQVFMHFLPRELAT